MHLVHSRPSYMLPSLCYPLLI